MAYSLDNKLVIGIASSALFDLKESDAYFRENGEEAYRAYQDAKVNDVLAPGVAFNFIKRLLSFNLLSESDDSLVEVIILSRNDPQTGLRVMKSIKAHGLDITRAIFTQGKSPYNFIKALNISLFLSANPQDVQDATKLGFAAGQVIGNPVPDDDSAELLVAFDFDGVLAGDSAEGIYQNQGIEEYQKHEAENASIPLEEGPLTELLKALNRIQKHELEIAKACAGYKPKLRIAIVTARNAPADERVLSTLKEHGLYVNDAFFLGGIEKASILEELKPQIFFDDQMKHLENAANSIPCVHVPFGITNQLPSARNNKNQSENEPS